MLSVPFGVIKFVLPVCCKPYHIKINNIYALSWPIKGSGPFLKFIFLTVEQDSKVEVNDETCFVHYQYHQILN